MMLARPVAAVALVASALGAQQRALHVIRRTPGDTASTANLVTITFDRPVAGRLDQTIDAGRIFRIEPALPGRIEWRDPITIRFIPNERLRAGSEFVVTIDTTFRAIDGSRLAEPYRFAFRVPGARLIARSFGGDNPNYPGALPMDGKVTLLYTEAVDLERIALGARLELARCDDGPRRIAFRPVRQRPVAPGDPGAFVGRWDRDTTADRFRRVVELEPESPLPHGCSGLFVLPTTEQDAVHGREERFAVATVPRFRLASVDCGPPAHCSLDRIGLSFTAPVRIEDLRRAVTLEPRMAFKIEGFSNVVGGLSTVGTSWGLNVRLAPHSTYTVVVDSALRDVYGRTLEGPHRVRVVTSDHLPSIAYAHGTITVPRSGRRMLPMRHVNVSAVRIITYRIPESQRARVLGLERLQLSREIGQLAGVPESTTVAVSGTLNVERVSELPLPPSVTAPGAGLVALRVEVANEISGVTPSSEAAARRTGLRLVQIIASAGGPDFLTYTFVQVTDLAAHGKIGTGESVVLVTGLADGRPRAGVAVRRIDGDGTTIGSGITDSSGVAELPGGGPSIPRTSNAPIADDWPPRFSVVEATLGDDRVIVPLGAARAIGYEPRSPLDPWMLGGRRETVSPAAAVVFLDRGIYRPGEMVYLKGIVRRGLLGELKALTPRDSVRLTLTYRPNEWIRDDNVVVHDTILAASEFGTVTDSFRLRPTLSLGTYVADLHVGRPGAWQKIGGESIRVSEYRAPEFLVETQTDSTPKWSGDTARVHVQAKYLFGAPMGRASVSWGAVLHELMPWQLHIPGADGWTVGEWDWWSWPDPRQKPLERLDGTDSLDAFGRVALRVPIGELGASRPGRLDVDVAVTDVNRQAISSSVSVPVQASHVYVLARKQGRSWYWTVGQAEAVEIRAVRADGTDVVDQPVIVTVVRREWRPMLVTGAGQWSETAIRTDTLRTAVRPVMYTFTPSLGGLHELRLSAEDGRGTTARTTMGVYAIAAGSGWRAQSPYHLPLVSEPRELAVGDEAQVAFDSPFDDAEAWVTVEREQVLERHWIRATRGPNIIRVPIHDAYVPNVFVSVLLLRHSTAGMLRPDSAWALVRAGYTVLRVATASRRLSVAIEPRAPQYGPGDTAVIRVRVRDHSARGTRSEVALWAVDEGVLALTEFETPDVLTNMYRARGLGLGIWSTLPTILTSDPGMLARFERVFRASLSATVAGMAAASAGTRGQAAEPMRSRFRSTAFYLASVLTNEAGDVEVRAQLPDNLTSYRVMAVAVAGDDRFGSGDTTLLVTRPLVARPTLPRFVRAGDTLVAGALVNARDGQSHAVSVHAETDGIVIQGESHRDIVLAAGKGAEARFTLGVPPRTSARDTVIVRLRASDGSMGDAVETHLPVRPDFHPRTHTQLGTLRGAADVVFDLPSDIDAVRSRLSLRVGTSPLAPMLAAYEHLRVYPYFCTEQIASGGRALLAIWRATRDRDPNALGGDPRQRLQDLADELARRVQRNGGIRYWNDHEWTSPWLTTYAGLFLLDARAEGIVVDSIVLARISAYLGEAAHVPVDTGGMNRADRRTRRLALGDRVAIVEFRRRLGVADNKAEDELLRLTPTMTWEDRLRLAEALAPRQDVIGQAQALVDAGWRSVTPAGRRVDLPDSALTDRAFPSRVAPAARLLTASLALRPEHPLLGGLVETVLQYGRAERQRSWNTQDYASVVLALAALRRTESDDGEARVLGGGRTLLSRRFGAADSVAFIPLTDLLERGRDGQTRLRVRVTSTLPASPVYYAISVDEVPTKPPVTPDMQGIVVERWYERFDNGSPVTAVQEGDLVRVRLRVTVPFDRQFVAVEDPLPAGLEPVDLSLNTSATLGAFVTRESDAARERGDRDRDGPRWQSWLYGSWDDGWWSPWDHKALHDDRVVYFARMLWAGSYTASYVARATTAGTFARPPAHAEEMYNPALQGRSDGGRFGVTERRP